MACPYERVAASSPRHGGAPAPNGAGRRKEAAEKRCGIVSLRRQRATKNLHWLENTECRSFAPKIAAQDDSVLSFFPQPGRAAFAAW
jgi:hypothetical protein